MILPTNEDSNTIGYGTRFLISSPGRYPPIAWEISKVQDKINGDITYFTMTQEQFSTSLDNAEEMIGGYYQSYVAPTEPEVDTKPSALKIVYTGQPTVRAGGSYKKFELKCNIDGVLTNVSDDIVWTLDFGGKDTNVFETIQDKNIFKIKCLPDYSLIGETFTITAQVGNDSKSEVVEVISI